ncbi:MAG: hypothetical protein WAO81_12255 [Methanosarcina flavescens]
MLRKETTALKVSVFNPNLISRKSSSSFDNVLGFRFTCVFILRYCGKGKAY